MSATALRRLLAEPGIIVQPNVCGALGARIAEDHGFKAVGLGGYSMGSAMVVAEPLLSIDDIARFTREVSQVSRLPVMVDIGAGFGEPIHVRRSVELIEHAGGAAVHVEDQWFPKRAHYHKGVEHVVPLDELVSRVRSALAARRNPDFVIVGRTDAMLTDGYDEGIRRAAACAEAGADMVMLFPNNEEETRRAPADLPGVPLIYVNSYGNSRGRGVFNYHDLNEWGWKLVSDTAPPYATAGVLRDAMSKLAETGLSMEPADARSARDYLEHVMNLEELYEVERQTVEH